MSQADTVGNALGSLAGRRALVTGASSGIGREISLELARGGADVLVHCRSSLDAARDVSAEIVRLGRKSEVLVADFNDVALLPLFADRVWNTWNGIEICVNNAGVDLLTGSTAALAYAEKLQQLLDVDVRATILLSREIGHRMQTAGRGVLVNVGWDQADRGMEGDSGELFSAAKNAVMGFTRSLALSLAPHVRVNCIAAGWIRTAWGNQAGDTWQKRVLRETPLARWGTPADVAKVARFLASDDAAYITGQVLNVNGGAVR